MTEQQFIEKWKNSTTFPHWESTAGEVYWVRSYNRDSGMGEELTFDFLSTNPPLGMSRSKALDYIVSIGYDPISLEKTCSVCGGSCYIDDEDLIMIPCPSCELNQ